MKVEYNRMINDWDGALRLSKIKVRLRLDTSKIEVRWRQNTMIEIVPYDWVRLKQDGGQIQVRQK